MKKIIIAALAAFPVVASANIDQAFNQIGIYGQIVTNPSTVSASGPYGSGSASGSNTVGGIGATASGVNQWLWYTHLGFNYGFGAPINGGSGSGFDKFLGSGSGSINGAEHTHGHSLQFNLRVGKLFPFSSDIAVGPYLAYQYAGFAVGVNGVGTLTYDNNAIGGGIEAGTVLGNGLSFTGHVGYLAGVDASAGDGVGSLTHTPSSDDLQLGIRGNYAFTSNFGVFAGINYDRYSASDSDAAYAISGSATINQIRGLVGISYLY